MCLCVNEYVFIFDIAMNDSDLVDLSNCLNELLEDGTSHIFFQGPVVTDKVKEIFDVAGCSLDFFLLSNFGHHPFQDEHKAVGQLKVLDQLDDSVNVVGHVHQADLDGYSLVDTSIDDSAFVDDFDGHGEMVVVAVAGVHRSKASFSKQGASGVLLVEFAFADHVGVCNTKRNTYVKRVF